MADLFIVLRVIRGQSGNAEGMENSRWRKEKGRDTQSLYSVAGNRKR